MAIGTTKLFDVVASSFGTAKEYHTDGLIFDVTGPINDIMEGKSEEKDFIENLNTLFSFNGEDFTNRTLYYVAGKI
ncbi:unnamed protein product [Orchesella dallaii]|uniref:Uncharacterized protein n=1 Tax=Orchesella dallaii TaxID=48710 RepID=A0ABP1PI50_9HEXA